LRDRGGLRVRVWFEERREKGFLKKKDLGEERESEPEGEWGRRVKEGRHRERREVAGILFCQHLYPLNRVNLIGWT